MSQLSPRLQELISQGLQICGLTPDYDAYHYIVERLHSDEVEEAKEFFKWLLTTKRPYGPGNAQTRWQEFKGEIDYQPLPKWFLEMAEKNEEDIHLTRR